MLSIGTAHSAFDTVAHVIQIALTPIFLLTGIAGLLSVFSTRHSYVTQHVDTLLREIASRTAVDRNTVRQQFNNLRRRSILLDVAVILGILGGTATCGAAMLLFVGELDDSTTGSLLFGMFGAALIFTITALASFATEMMLAGHGIRNRMAEAETEANVAPPPMAKGEGRPA